MTASFNLTEQPWIPCEQADGTTVELSTREALVRAHELRGIADESPLVVAVLHRHLLAILHRSYAGPRTMKEWAEIAHAKSFDASRVEAYLSRVRDRMDLLHPTHPFAQTRGLVERGIRVNAIDQLEVERSGWGQARALFQHRPAGFRPTTSAARATRLVLAHHAFAMHGTLMNPAEGKSLGESHSASAGPLVHCAVILLRGENLFTTLVANLLRYDPEMSQPVAPMGDDRPSWEQDPLPARVTAHKEFRRAPYGWLDALTWLSRRIELVANGDEVTGFTRGIGQGLAEEPLFTDPMVTYGRDRRGGYRPIGIDSHRAFWRDANALFEAARSDSPAYRRPAALDLVASATVRGNLPPEAVFSLDVIGMHAESGVKTSVHMVRHETLTVKANLLSDPDARESVEHVLHLCQRSVETLTSALKTYARSALAPGDRKPDPKDIRELVRALGAEPAAWSALGIEFDVFLRTLGNNMDEQPLERARDLVLARNQFERQLRKIIRQGFLEVISRSDAAGGGLKARALAERRLDEGLGYVLATDAPSRTSDTPVITQESSHA